MNKIAGQFHGSDHDPDSSKGTARDQGDQNLINTGESSNS